MLGLSGAIYSNVSVYGRRLKPVSKMSLTGSDQSS